MRFVALAALSAAFWLLVATVRLIVHPPAPFAAGTAQIVPATPGIAPTWTPALTVRQGIFRDDHDQGGCGGIYSLEDEPGYAPPLGRLPRSEIIAGLDAVKPLIHACYEMYRVSGTAMVNVRGALDGSVRAANVKGRFAGTPTGACVEAAVKTARFPASLGFALSYPLQLR